MTSHTWLPQSIAQAAKLAEQGKTASEIGAIMGRTANAVRRLSSSGKITLLSASSRRPVPDDFEEMEHGRSAKELRIHYSCSEHTVARWRREIGVNRLEEYRASLRAPTQKGRPKSFVHNRYQKRTPDAPFRDESAAGAAQRYLQADRPVYRISSSMWQCGALKLTDGELVAKAAEIKARRELQGRLG